MGEKGHGSCKFIHFAWKTNCLITEASGEKPLTRVGVRRKSKLFGKLLLSVPTKKEAELRLMLYALSFIHLFFSSRLSWRAFFQTNFNTFLPLSSSWYDCRKTLCCNTFFITFGLMCGKAPISCFAFLPSGRPQRESRREELCSLGVCWASYLAAHIYEASESSHVCRHIFLW